MDPNKVSMKKEMQGCLQRQQGGMFNRWKPGFYECRGGFLKEFSVSGNPETSSPREVFDLSASYVEDGAAVTSKPFSFILNTKQGTVYLLATSDVEKMKWMQTLGGRMMVRKTNFADSSASTSNLNLSSGSSTGNAAAATHSTASATATSSPVSSPPGSPSPAAGATGTSKSSSAPSSPYASMKFGKQRPSILLPAQEFSKEGGSGTGTPSSGGSIPPTTPRVEGGNPDIGLRMEFNNSVIIPLEKYYVLESIRFSLLEGRNFKGKKKGGNNYYVNVYVDNIHKGRSSIQWNNPTPFWSENFLFENVGDARFVNLVVCNVGSRDNKSDSLIVGEADVSLKTIGKGVTWVTLKTKSDKPTESPAISVEAIKMRLKILPLKEYAHFAKSILEDDLTAPKLLANIIGSGAKIEEVARRLLNVFLLNNKAFHLATTLACQEINQTDTSAILFRGNSLATKVIDLFMKEFGEPYVRSTLRGPVEEIYNDKNSCEVDPSKMEKVLDLQPARKRLIEHVQNCWKAIKTSAAQMPNEMKIVFKAIREEIVKKFPEDDNMKYIAVVGFAFLRFFCPAVLNPYLFGIMEDHPDEVSKRTLTLVAKTLQNLANLVEFGEKESYMVFLNTFIIDSKKELKDFVNSICEPSEIPEEVAPLNRHLNKEYAYLYQFFQEYREKIREYEEGHPDQKLKDFLRTFMKLEFTYSLHDRD